jgi:DNA adenine methylase
MIKKIPPVIKWTGSKRSQADKIIGLFPDFERYFEPFIGGGSVLVKSGAKTAICGDVCKPLIDFWNMIKDNPSKLVKEYELRWNRLQDEGYMTYYNIRDKFNENQNPYDLLFLSRTSINGLIRFNRKGNFNSSFHNNRKGINPKTLEDIIFKWSKLIQNYKFIHGDYIETTKSITSRDFVYMDPPYFNTSGMYYGNIEHDDFIDYLEELNSKHIKFVLSFDGERGSTKFSGNLPKKLFKRHLLLESGNSPFKKSHKQVESVKESIYINF